MGEALLIASGRGGAGRSVIAANVAAGLARLGYHVALVDGCVGMRSLDIMLGLENSAIYDMQDLAEGLCAPRQALMAVPGEPRLELLNAPPLTTPSELGAAAFRAAVDRVRNNHRYVVIDGPAGVDTLFQMALSVCARALVVTRLDDPIALRAAERAAQYMRGAGMGDLRLIVNHLSPEIAGEEGEYPSQAAARRLDAPLIGLVPEDEALTATPPLARPGTPLGRIFEDIARRVSGDNMPLRPYAAPTPPPRRKKPWE